MSPKNICRVCLFELDVQTTCLFKYCQFASMTYADMLCYITNIKVTVNDGLPDEMCKSCRQNLEKAYSFTVLAKNSDKKLRESGNVKQKLSFNSITDIKKELKTLSAKKEKTKLVFNSLSDIKSKIKDLNVKKEKTWDVAIVNTNVPKPGKTSTIANTTIKKVERENNEPIFNIEISDDDEDKSDDNFFKDDTNGDPDYWPSKEEKAPSKQKQPKPVDNKKSKPFEVRLKIGNACIITNRNPQLNIKKVKSTQNQSSKNGAASTVRMKKAKAAVNGKRKVDPTKDKQPVGLKITDAAIVTTKRNLKDGYKDKMVCQICGILTFSLDQHMFTHKEKEFKCQMCDKEYHTQSQLDAHVLNHTGEKTFICDECGKGYINKKTLIRHTLSIHQNKGFVCPICTKNFSNRSTLRNHMDTHEGIKRHVCAVCGMAFRRQHHLKAHMVTHTGERSYSCEVCDMDFPYKANLNTHVFREHNIDIKGRQISKFTRELLRQQIDRLERALSNEIQNMNSVNVSVDTKLNPSLSAF